ncbi:ABC transporter ATP-binding protein [Candidatus Pelagibacter communis]|uniref:ABC transporter ATP-binding protein n=1 Tax=Pelagibacter ubique TaxID=198252 RepID=UPI000A5061E2|nr:ABC transporter ATP-binding protein [Candidatus Pelagibacter ubique]
MTILGKLIFILTPKERKSASFLLLMILLMALIDVIGVASILPFMSVLVNPSLIETNFILIKMFEFFKSFGIENKEQFLFLLGTIVFVILITSLIFKAITTYFQIRFKEMVQYSLSKRLVEKYLHQPYEWFLSNHTAEAGKTILSEVSNVCSSGIRPLFELISRAIVSILIIILLFLTDPKLTLGVGFLIGGIYYLIFFFSKKYLNLIGEENLQQNHLRYKSIIDAFGASKEVKVRGLEKNFIKNFSVPSKIFAVNKAFVGLVSLLPRYILEATAFGGIILIILYKMSQSGTFSTALPIISLYVFAGYRLMPAAQNIYASFSQITFTGPSIEKLYTDINNLNPIDLDQDESVLPLNKKISLKNICYSYPNASRTALKNISLNISVKNTIGLVGATGSGKTTIVDIILGLLEAQKGNLEIDGKIINKQNTKSWQRSIGYVPQQIYLSDDTIAANIAFGQEPKDINDEEIQKVSKIANLHEFIMNELPNQYQTIIGERGVRLSGGQRQRIGIARALYFNPQVLILDEATSALDNLTEKHVMDAVNNLSKHKTIIMIAHRLSTVKNCDKIFLFEKGELKNEGTFDELINKNENFKKSVIN